MSIIPLAIAAGLLVSASTGAQPATPATGTIGAQAPCAFTSYEETSAFTRRYYSRDEYTATVANPAVECLRIQYSSDGLKVVGFLVRPRANGAAKYPVIVYNRGGFRDIGKIDSWNLIDFYGFASQGFVVLASQYRGNDGGEGRDEVGGADVADVMALMQLARQLPYADAANVFLYGLSRGGMMSFLALKQGFPAKAAAVVGALVDLEAMNHRAPEMGEEGHGGQRRFRPRRRGGAARAVGDELAGTDQRPAAHHPRRERSGSARGRRHGVRHATRRASQTLSVDRVCG
jgi:acetyl esterase/lipase